MVNLTSNFTRASAAVLAALGVLLLALYIPSMLHNFNPCLTSNSCLTPFQLDVLFQKVTNATNGNIANTLAVVQEIQAEVPACPGGRPSGHGKGDHDIEQPWVRDITVLTRTINCAKCWCLGGCCLSALTCVPCCQSNGTI